MNSVMLNNDSKVTKVHPQKFALWIGMASIIMLFGAWTSAYIVKHAAGNWLEFPIPPIFYGSAAVAVCCSIVLYMAHKSFKEANEKPFKLYTLIGFILGVLFVIFQTIGWNQLFGMGVDLKGNVAGSFFYLITGAHAAHVLGGIAALSVTLLNAFTLPFKHSEKRLLRIDLVVQYWHFVDALWIYLLIFLLTIN